MQAYHCVFGFGALIGPLIVEPFLLDTETQTHVSIPGKRVYNADYVNIEHIAINVYINLCNVNIIFYFDICTLRGLHGIIFDQIATYFHTPWLKTLCLGRFSKPMVGFNLPRHNVFNQGVRR